ncbi:MAG: RDD family protein [Alphaproteobacteria bacterium]|nr:MAG: RDD family protein [Alphaproteobacteria bacterium]
MLQHSSPRYAAAPGALPDPDRQAEFYADVPLKRFVAWLIDAVAILVLTVLVLPFTAFLGLFFFPLLWLAVGIGYRMAFLARSSATPGMWLLSIELRDRCGRRLDPGTALAHTLLYTVFLATMVVQAISVALMLSTPRRQGLHDIVLGTAMINRPARP